MSNNIITIEKNVPIPELTRGPGSCGKYKFVEENMEVGDSFVVNGNTPDITPRALKSWVYNRKRKATKLSLRRRAYAIRTLSGTCSNPISIRVWRVA
jgi:hypothetical protein